MSKSGDLMLPIFTWPPPSRRWFWDNYNKAKWGPFPLTESNQIVRIPISGPAPFNTLAVVRGFFLDQGLYWRDDWSNGRFHRQSFSVRTPFKLADFVSGQTPDFKHSTAAALRYQYFQPDTTFTYAVDTIDAHFSDGGEWQLDVGTSFLVDNAWAAAQFHFSSFVLCYEPPIDFEKNPGTPFAGPFKQPVFPDAP
jgi:hypothetical protein